LVIECFAKQGAMGIQKGLLACNAPLGVVATATPSRGANSIRLQNNSKVITALRRQTENQLQTPKKDSSMSIFINQFILTISHISHTIHRQKA